MHFHIGPDASIEFQQRLRFLKNSRLYWCAVTVAWRGAELPRWAQDTTLMALMRDRLLKALATEEDKVWLLLLPSGDVIVLGETLSNAAYQRVSMALQALLAELAIPPSDWECRSYDLSVDWDAFMTACRDMYSRTAAMTEKVQAAERERYCGALLPS